MITNIYSPNNRYMVKIGKEFKLTDIGSEHFCDVAYPDDIDFACFSEDSRFIAMKNKQGYLMIYDINYDEIVFDKALSITTGRAMWFAKPATTREVVDSRTQVLHIELENCGQVEFNWKKHVRDDERDSLLKRELSQEAMKYFTKLKVRLGKETINKAPKLTLESPKHIANTKTTHAAYISPDSRYFFVMGMTVSIYNFDNREKIGSDIDVVNAPTKLGFSNDGKLVAIKNSTGDIAIVDIMTRDVLYKSKFANMEGSTVCFTPDDRYVVTCDWHSNIICLDVKNSTHMAISIKDFARNSSNLCITEMQKIEDAFLFYCEGISGSFAHICWKYPFEKHEIELIMGESPKYEAEDGNVDDCVCKARCVKNNKEAWVSSINRKLVICDEYRTVIATPLEAYETLIPFYNKNGWSTDGNYYVAMVEAENEHAKIQYVNVYETETWTIVKRYDTGSFLCFAEFSSDGEHLIIGTWEKGFVIDVADIVT